MPSPATAGVKSGSATSNKLYSDSEWSEFLKINPGVKDMDMLRDRLNKIKKEMNSKGAR